jgi:hypothetical protein
MRATFAQNSPAVHALFDALAELLTSGGRKQKPPTPSSNRKRLR